MKIEISYDNGPKTRVESVPASRQWIPVLPPSGCRMVTIFVQVPLVDVQMAWMNTVLGGPTNCLEWQMRHDSGAQKNMPYLALLNRSGQLKAALATTALWNDTRIAAVMNQEMGTYDVTFTVAWDDDSGSGFEFMADSTTDWQEGLEVWRDRVCPDKQEFPSGAYEPVFCSWYAMHGGVTEQWIEKQAPVLAEMGFGTLIVDDGWCYDECKRVSPSTISTWYAPVGDWEVSEKKFPDFPAHVKRMQALGLNYMLWVAPHLIGTASKVYREHPECALEATPSEGCVSLDVRRTEHLECLKKRLVALVHDNGLDGLKIDFLDIVAPDVDSPNGLRTGTFIREIVGALRKEKPGCLIEFRQNYATPATLPYATQFRAADVPFDWQLNFQRLVDVRLCLGNRAPVHADPAFWPKDETRENVVRHLMAMMIGVPMLSVDVTKLQEWERKLVRHWLHFYQDWKEVINHGKWHFIYHSNVVAVAIAEYGQRRLTLVNQPAPMAEWLPECGQAAILNLSDVSLPVKGFRVFSGQGEAMTGTVIPPAGYGIGE